MGRVIELGTATSVNYSDPFGLCAVGTNEKPCRSRDEAARRGMRSIFRASVRENREYTGEVVRAGKGQYFYTPGRVGSAQFGDPARTDIDGYDGYYHSHGAADPRYDSERFSDSDDCKSQGLARRTCDKPLADDTGKPGYVVTPSGRMKRYDPDPAKQDGGRVTTIGRIDP